MSNSLKFSLKLLNTLSLLVLSHKCEVFLPLKLLTETEVTSPDFLTTKNLASLLALASLHVVLVEDLVIFLLHVFSKFLDEFLSLFLLLFFTQSIHSARV